MIKNNISISLYLDYFIENISTLDDEKLSLFLAPFVNSKFKISDTGFTYRQINYLEKIGIWEDKRKTKNSWREFTLREVVYLAIIKKLRLFGVKIDYLKKVKNVFYSKKNSLNIDLFILMALSNMKINFVIGEKEALFVDNLGMVIFEKSRNIDNYFVLKLNNIIRKTDKFSNMKDAETIADIFLKEKENNQLTEQEIKIMEIIRAKDYKSFDMKEDENGYLVKIKKSEKVLSGEDVGKAIERIKKMGFGKVSTIIQDNNEVGLETEETIRI